MGASVIHGEPEIRKILESACGNRELMILVTPYLRFESNFLALGPDAIHGRITMSSEEATYGLRSPDLHFRFPHATRFLEGQTRFLGFGLLDGRRTLRLGIPRSLQDDEHRRAYRVERIGKVPVTFSTPKFQLKSGMLIDISTMGARIVSPHEGLEPLLKSGDAIALSISLAESLHIDGHAIVRWVQGKSLGAEFHPALDTAMLTPLSRWVFQRREEDKERLAAAPAASDNSAQSGLASALVLVSSSQGLEDSLRDLVAGLPPLKRIGATVQAVKEALVMGPALVIFHVADGGLDSRRRLKTLVEVLGGRVPFILLGTQVENSVLFDLGSEHKAAAVYDLGAKPGSFFLRLMQGILRRHPGEGA